MVFPPPEELTILTTVSLMQRLLAPYGIITDESKIFLIFYDLLLYFTVLFNKNSTRFYILHYELIRFSPFSI